MKKYLALLALSVSLTTVATAQQDPKAGKILDQMSAKYQAMKAFKATFTQTLENDAAKVKENLSGDITVSGQKFRLKMSGQEVINNGQTMWTYMKAENEVNISDYEPEDQEISPSQIYTLYKKGYKYAYVQEAKEGGELVDVIELSPEDRNNPVYKVRLKVGKTDKAVKSWQMFKKNGNRYTYKISKFQPNVPVDATTFNFDKAKYKGVKVIDLR
ncbi:outer membrane lipoprotein carrier protein LolA [Hymenobacter sp. 5516J-16]|uniref:Outer membrane lipoprotein carrier protein LolA n=1 Tax=Hymenobacter sublimis TaxID=2933777 RepID=A0ABY4JFD6_9BACT|nr:MULTISPECIES: outer membrane lipoprotein carrier protein LolA [Hymenobacter]UOQ77019.1 outer membrane lipoprotein carrier protein LolA [Hymenobacter sp. 5516J-16]UPL50703.1 outer membrane lipoprotein carrier protein LolA [Hymenobacter sublimis]